jgi:S1-C subfamily serine protease
MPCARPRPRRRSRRRAAPRGPPRSPARAPPGRADARAAPQTRTATRSTGSGVLVERRGDVCVVLTAAHVVANSTFIQVQLAGQPDKVTAFVTAVAHETDLATVDVPAAFFEGVAPLPLAPPDALPALRDKVFVLVRPRCALR